MIAVGPASEIDAVGEPRRVTLFGPSAAGEPPLCVDLDGTLVAGDLLWESVAALARRNPLLLFFVPVWLLKGKAHLKSRLAEVVRLDPSQLPYREQVLLFLVQEKARGRRVVLATASHERIARAVADHVGVFDEVIATGDGMNLKGAAKLRALEARFGARGFDYIGDAACDVAIWQEARRAYVVGGRRRLAQAGTGAEHLSAGPGGRLRNAIRLLRPHQWAKNLLLFVPMMLAHRLTDTHRLWDVACAFVAFCCCASAVYVLNDLADLDADRRHPAKRRRPLASGAVSLPVGAGMFGLLLVAGLSVPVVAGLSAEFLGMLALYMGVTTAYSLHLKRVALLDVFVLAGLYAHRVLAGGVAAGTGVSGWLMAFSMFFFVSLALAKRYAELSRVAVERRSEPQRRGYAVDDLGLIGTLGPAAGCAAVLPLCLYVNGAEVSQLYARPELLWFACPVVFYWIARVWLLARRGQLNEDPVTFALKDGASYASGALVGVTLLLACV